MPERTAPAIRENESANGNALGETVPMVIASSAPAKPAIPALIVKAKTLERAVLIPASWAATSLLRPALHARP
jgi:hypothetical protein